MDKNFFIKNKKKIIIVVIVLAISLIGFSLLNSTYSLFYHEDIASNSDNYSTGLLSITATGKGDSISLTNTLPMSDTEGAATTAYTFTIKNIGNLDYKFNVKLLSTGNSSTTIDSQYIKVKVNNDPATTLSSLSNSIIKNNITLSAGQSIDISIRVWLSSDTPNTQIGKIFNSKIVTDGQAVYTSTNKSVYDYWTGAAKTIADLYTNSTKTPVSLNNVTYQYDTTNNLIADVAGNIRYYGAEPNNYIYFNCSDYSNQSSSTCETWRIIGVFDGNVKIMRNEIIGSILYDNDNEDTYLQSIARDNDGNNSRVELLKYNISDDDIIIKLAPEIPSGIGQNDYSKSSLQKILNNYYYNGLKYTGAWTYDFTSIGLKNDTTRNLIDNITYNLGGYNDSSIYSNQIYGYERGTTVPSGNATTWTGKIAVAYPSDYGYAADLSLCQKQLVSYNDATCTANNWMKNIITNNGANYGWLLTPFSGSANRAWYVYPAGNVNEDGIAVNAYRVAPVLSLTSKLGIGPGSGTSSSPYQLSV